MAKTSPVRRIRRSISAGQSRPIHPQEAKDLPCVREALAWLLSQPATGRLDDLLRTARLKRVIDRNGKGFHVERPVVDALISRNRSIPSPEAAYGLGELVAHSIRSAAPALPQLAKLKANEVRKYLRRVEEISQEYVLAEPFADLTIGENLREQQLTASLYQYADNYIQRQHSPYRKVFGLSVVAETFLTFHPVLFGKWLSGPLPARLEHTIVGYVAERLIFRSPNEVFPSKVVKSGLPLLQAMVASARVVGFFNRTPATFQETFDWLTAADLDEVGAFLLALPGLGEPILALRRADAELTKATQQFSAAALRHFSDPSGSDTGTLVGFKDGLDQAAALRLDAEKALENVISLVARHWPPLGVPDDAMSLVFWFLRPDAIHYASLLVQAVGSGKGIDRLRQYIVDQVFAQIGLDDPDAAMSSRPYFAQHELPRLCYWAAVHFVELNKGKPRGVARIAGPILEPLLRKSQGVMHAPYAAARGLHHSTATSRNAALLLLAFAIAAQGRAAGQDMGYFIDHTLDEIRLLLIAADGWLPDFQIFDELVRVSVSFMAGIPAHDRRQAWSGDAALPDYPRALAVWSLPDLAGVNPSAAADMFQSVGQVKKGQSVERCFTQTTVLLDTAFTGATRERNGAHLRMIRLFWRPIWQAWDEKAHAYGQGIFEMLQKSEQGDQLAREYFLNEGWWRGSLWTAFLKEATQVAVQPNK